jgi:tetratricopeptide (TPR) repeat protein
MILSKTFTPAAFRGLAASFAAALVLGACATSPMERQSLLDSMLSQADDEVAKGRRDAALELLNRAAKESPASPAPWLKIANIWFDEGNYASSILAANEVLQREPASQEAKSLLVVAGLRVAAKNARGLASVNAINSNARNEAESLTKSLKAKIC